MPQYRQRTHTYLKGPWYECARCGFTAKVADMQWQRGLFLCSTCVDKMLLGQRELAIAEILSDGKEELVPVEKLRRPSDATDDNDDFFMI